jgi:hypothetical protein
LVNLDDSADHDGRAGEHMPPSSSNPACNTARDTVYSDSIFGPTQAQTLFRPIFRLFASMDFTERLTATDIKVRIRMS